MKTTTSCAVFHPLSSGVGLDVPTSTVFVLCHGLCPPHGNSAPLFGSRELLDRKFPPVVLRLLCVFFTGNYVILRSFRCSFCWCGFRWTKPYPYLSFPCVRAVTRRSTTVLSPSALRVETSCLSPAACGARKCTETCALDVVFDALSVGVRFVGLRAVDLCGFCVVRALFASPGRERLLPSSTFPRNEEGLQLVFLGLPLLSGHAILPLFVSSFI